MTSNNRILVDNLNFLILLMSDNKQETCLSLQNFILNKFFLARR